MLQTCIKCASNAWVKQQTWYKYASNMLQILIKYASKAVMVYAQTIANMPQISFKQQQQEYSQQQQQQQ